MKSLIQFTHPWLGFVDFRRDMDELMDQAFAPEATKTASFALKPACDVDESETKFTLQLDMPGLSQEEVRIELNKNELVISGERKREVKNSKNSENFERAFGKFERRFTLPTNVNLDAIEAHMERGVLQLEIPKVEPVKPREIKIGVPKNDVKIETTAA